MEYFTSRRRSAIPTPASDDVTLLSRTAAGRNPHIDPGSGMTWGPSVGCPFGDNWYQANQCIDGTTAHQQRLDTLLAGVMHHETYGITNKWGHEQRMVEYILHNPDDPRADDLFEEMTPLLRAENVMLTINTAWILGRADAERPGKWTGELMAIARDMVDERNDVVTKGLISNGSPVLKNQGRPLLIRRLMEVSEENPPGARYAASILVNGLWDLPGAREELRGLYDRGEIRGVARFAVWGKLQRGGG